MFGMRSRNVKDSVELTGQTLGLAKQGSLPRSELLRIDLLYAFEACARLLSITQAASELHLTQSAVSRQIQQLEENLQCPLFHRKHRAIELTLAGQILSRAVNDSFERLLDAQARIRSTSSARQVAITCTPGFASLWLIPRLAKFTADHPLVDVRISATSVLEDLERSGIDVAVRFAPMASTKGLPLFEETVLPMCAPRLAKGRGATLKNPVDLAAHTLLAVDMPHGQSLSVDWEPWLNIMGMTHLSMKNTVRFSQYSDAIAAAVAGQGVVIGRLPLLRDHVREGRLVAPFKGAAISRRGYFVLVAKRSENNRDALDFVHWLRREAEMARLSGVPGALGV
jgi:LysR family transcriptional regulator, glycine cleavage system transcriptional activator